MAKNIDDFDFDSELDDLDNLFGEEAPKPKNTREAISMGMKDVGNSIKESLSPNFSNYKSFIDNAIPKDAQSGVNFVSDIKDSFFFENMKQLDSLKKNSIGLKKEILKIVKADSKLGSTINKIGEFLGLDDDHSSDYRPETLEEQQQRMLEEFSNTIGEQFSKQTAINLANEVKHEQQFKSTLSGLASINKQMMVLNNFNNELTSSYYKKSLELQYQQLFVTKSLFKITQEGNEANVKQLESIIKNTSLPDAAKLLNKEIIAQITKTNVINKVQSYIGDLTPMAAIKNRLGKIGKNFISNLNDKINMAKMATDQIGMMQEMESMGGGSMTYNIANMATSSLKDYAAGLMGKTINRDVRVKKFNRKAVDFMADPVTYVNSILNDKMEKTEFGSFKHSILEKISDGLNLFKYKPGNNGMDYLESNPDNVSIFDNRTKDSIVKVIPGLLSKIYSEIKASRTGMNPNRHEISYDFNEQKFYTVREQINKTKKKFIKDHHSKISYTMDNIVEVYKKYGKFSRQELTLLAGNMFSYLMSNKRTMNLSSLVKDDFLNFIDYSIRDKVKEVGETLLTDLDKVDNDDIVKLTNAMVNVADGLPSIDDTLLEQFNSGDTRTAKALGLLDKNSKGYSVNSSGKLKFFKDNFKYEYKGYMEDENDSSHKSKEEAAEELKKEKQRREENSKTVAENFKDIINEEKKEIVKNYRKVKGYSKKYTRKAKKELDPYLEKLDPHMKKVQEVTDPYIKEVKDKINPYLDQAKELSDPYIKQIKENIKDPVLKELSPYLKIKTDKKTGKVTYEINKKYVNKLKKNLGKDYDKTINYIKNANTETVKKDIKVAAYAAMNTIEGFTSKENMDKIKNDISTFGKEKIDPNLQQAKNKITEVINDNNKKIEEVTGVNLKGIAEEKYVYVTKEGQKILDPVKTKMQEFVKEVTNKYGVKSVVVNEEFFNKLNAKFKGNTDKAMEYFKNTDIETIKKDILNNKGNLKDDLLNKYKQSKKYFTGLYGNIKNYINKDNTKEETIKPDTKQQQTQQETKFTNKSGYTWEDIIKLYKSYKDRFIDDEITIDDYAHNVLTISMEEIVTLKTKYNDEVIAKSDKTISEQKSIKEKMKSEIDKYKNDMFKYFTDKIFKKQGKPKTKEELRTEFFESEEYKSGAVDNLEQWLEAQIDSSKKTRAGMIFKLLKASWALDRKLTLGLLKGVSKVSKFGIKTAWKTGKFLTKNGLKMAGKTAYTAATALPSQLYNLVADKYGLPHVDPGFSQGSRSLDRYLFRNSLKGAKLGLKVLKLPGTIWKGIKGVKNFLFNDISKKPDISDDAKVIVAGLDNVKKSVDDTKPKEDSEISRKGSWLNRLNIFKKKSNKEDKETDKKKSLMQWMKDNKGLSITGGLLLISGLLKGIGITLDDVKSVAKGIWNGVKFVGGVFSTGYKVIKGSIDTLAAPFKWISNKLGLQREVEPVKNKNGEFKLMKDENGNVVKNENGEVLYETKDGTGATKEEILKSDSKRTIGDTVATAATLYGGAKLYGATKILPGSSIAKAGATTAEKTIKYGVKATANTLKNIKTYKTTTETIKSVSIGTKILEWGKTILSKIEWLIPDKFVIALKTGYETLKTKLDKSIKSFPQFVSKLNWLKRTISNPKFLKRVGITAATKLLTKITAAIAGIAAAPASMGITGILTALLSAWEIGWILWYMYGENMTFWQAFLKQLLGIDPDPELVTELEKDNPNENFLNKTTINGNTINVELHNKLKKEESRKEKTPTVSKRLDDKSVENVKQQPRLKTNVNELHQVVKKNNIRANVTLDDLAKNNVTKQKTPINKGNISPTTLDELTVTSQPDNIKRANREEALQYTDNLQKVKDWIVDPLKTKYGSNVRVNSGFRGPTLNKAIGGAKKSRHMEGKAVDIGGINTKQVAQDYIDGKIPGMPMGMNFIPEKRNSRWLHFDIDNFRMFNDLGKNTKHGGSVYEFEGLDTSNLVTKLNLDGVNIKPNQAKKEELNIANEGENHTVEEDNGQPIKSDKTSNTIQPVNNISTKNNNTDIVNTKQSIEEKPIVTKQQDLPPRLDSINPNSMLQSTSSTVKPVDNPKLDTTVLNSISKTLVDSYQVQVRMANTLDSISKNITNIGNTTNDKTSNDTNKNTQQEYKRPEPKFINKSLDKNSVSVGNKLRRNEYV